LRGVHDPRLRRRQLPSRRGGPTLPPCQRLAGFWTSWPIKSPH
jgi:hypothetical protein